MRLQNVLKKHEITASVFCHAAMGQVHIRPFLDLANTDNVRKHANWLPTSIRKSSPCRATSAAKTPAG